MSGIKNALAGVSFTGIQGGIVYREAGKPVKKELSLPNADSVDISETDGQTVSIEAFKSFGGLRIPLQKDVFDKSSLVKVDIDRLDKETTLTVDMSQPNKLPVIVKEAVNAHLKLKHYGNMLFDKVGVQSSIETNDYSAIKGNNLSQTYVETKGASHLDSKVIANARVNAGNKSVVTADYILYSDLSAHDAAKLKVGSKEERPVEQDVTSIDDLYSFEENEYFEIKPEDYEDLLNRISEKYCMLGGIQKSRINVDGESELDVTNLGTCHLTTRDEAKAHIEKSFTSTINHMSKRDEITPLLTVGDLYLGRDNAFKQHFGSISIVERAYGPPGNTAPNMILNQDSKAFLTVQNTGANLYQADQSYSEIYRLKPGTYSYFNNDNKGYLNSDILYQEKESKIVSANNSDISVKTQAGEMEVSNESTVYLGDSLGRLSLTDDAQANIGLLAGKLEQSKLSKAKIQTNIGDIVKRHGSMTHIVDHVPEAVNEVPLEIGENAGRIIQVEDSKTVIENFHRGSTIYKTDSSEFTVNSNVPEEAKIYDLKNTLNSVISQMVAKMKT